MYGGRVAMGKEVQREERWRYANRSGNRENEKNEQQADRSNGDLTRDIFPHFGGLVSHNKVGSTSVQILGYCTKGLLCP